MGPVQKTFGFDSGHRSEERPSPVTKTSDYLAFYRSSRLFQKATPESSLFLPEEGGPKLLPLGGFRLCVTWN